MSASTDALTAVVKSQGFAEFGVPRIIDLGSQRQVARKFHRNDEQIRVTIYAYKDPAKMKDRLKTIDESSQAIPFGNKLVVLEHLTPGAAALIPPLAEKLLRFRELLNEGDDAR
jgi:hypothetical protein